MPGSKWYALQFGLSSRQPPLTKDEHSSEAASQAGVSIISRMAPIAAGGEPSSVIRSFLKQPVMIVNGTKDPVDSWGGFDAAAKAGMTMKSQTMMSQTCSLVRRLSELRN
jgi:hypothetical protein